MKLIMSSTLSLLFLTLFLQFNVHALSNQGFVKTRGVQFVLNGTPFYAHGFNAYWLMFVASDPSQRYKVSEAFEQASSRGLRIVRAWAFSDGGSMPLQQSPGSYNENMFKGLDFAISEAKKYGIKLVLSLGNNFSDLGGKRQYIEWARNQGQSIHAEIDFYTNPLIKQFYKNNIKTVLTRKNTFTGVAYKDDPTIMAWELMNEPRAADQSGKTLQDWITEMASYLKSIDRNHLLTVGLEGFYGKSLAGRQDNIPYFLVGTDFISNHQIPGIDFATAHVYPIRWLPKASTAEQRSFLNKWVKNHIEDAQNVLHKPFMLAEFGFSVGGHEKNHMFNIVYSAIYSSASQGGAAAGSMFWQLLLPGMENFGDGSEVVFSKHISTTAIITREAKKLNRIH